MTETFINEALIDNSNRTTRETKDLKYIAYGLYEKGYLKIKVN